MTRSYEIDVLRGLMLVLITISHLPSRLTGPLGQPFGFVSAAEGFVFLSAFLAGLVFSRHSLRNGIQAMRHAFLRRAIKVYRTHVITLLFLFTIVTVMGVRRNQADVTNLIAWFLEYPVAGFGYAMALVYKPALLDILPMYVLFMLASPWVLSLALRYGWSLLLLFSLFVWFCTQFGLSKALYELAASWIHLPVPFRAMGAFNLLSWQLLWFSGLWLGCWRCFDHSPPETQISSSMLFIASSFALICLCWRHFSPFGQTPFGGDAQGFNVLFDKWQLGPLRLLNFAALAVLSIRFGPGLMRALPRFHVLETLGRASLPVFCTHLVLVLLVIAVYGSERLTRPWWGDVLLLTGVFTLLYLVALSTLMLGKLK